MIDTRNENRSNTPNSAEQLYDWPTRSYPAAIPEPIPSLDPYANDPYYPDPYL